MVGAGWIGILRGLGVSPRALRVSRSADRPVPRSVLPVMILLLVPWPAASCLARSPPVSRFVCVGAASVLFALRVRAARGPSCCSLRLPTRSSSWASCRCATEGHALSFRCASCFPQGSALGPVVLPSASWSGDACACGGRSGVRCVGLSGSRSVSRGPGLCHSPLLQRSRCLRRPSSVSLSVMEFTGAAPLDVRVVLLCGDRDVSRGLRPGPAGPPAV